MMAIKRILLSLIFLVVLPVHAFPDVHLNLESCEPSVVGKVQRMWNPRGFWIDQHIALQNVIEWSKTEKEFVYAVCTSSTYNTLAKRQECAIQRMKMWRSVVRCWKHAARMCRMHGGYC